MKIGDFLREQRKKRGLLQSDISKMSGIDQTSISYIEKYNRMPKFNIACKICKTLDITPTELWNNIKNEYEIKEIKRPPQEGEEGGRLEKGIL